MSANLLSQTEGEADSALGAERLAISSINRMHVSTRVSGKATVGGEVIEEAGSDERRSGSSVGQCPKDTLTEPEVP